MMKSVTGNALTCHFFIEYNNFLNLSYGIIALIGLIAYLSQVLPDFPFYKLQTFVFANGRIF